MLIPAVTLNAKRYDETFAVFVSRSGEYPVMVDRLTKLSARLPNGFSCLDIGAGPGKVLRDWVAHSRRRPGRYVAIEPSPTHASGLRATCADLGVEAQIEETSFDPGYAIAGKFDLVLFSHSLYWMDEPVDCVQRGFECVRSGGLVLVFLQGPFAVHSMYRLFNPMFERDEPPGPNQGFSSAELVAGLRRAGLTPDLTLDPTPLDLTGLFDDGNEQERDAFLSFCLQVEVPKLDETTRIDVVKHLRAACFERDGRTLWHAPNATIVLTRQ